MIGEAYSMHMEILREILPLGNLEVDERVGLICDRISGCELDSPGSGWGPATSFCEHDNEPSGLYKG
jgi:hypothetical protein